MLDGRIGKESGEWLSMWGTVANNLGKKGRLLIQVGKRVQAICTLAQTLLMCGFGSFGQQGTVSAVSKLL
jgi:hypothetical protein